MKPVSCISPANCLTAIWPLKVFCKFLYWPLVSLYWPFVSWSTVLWSHTISWFCIANNNNFHTFDLWPQILHVIIICIWIWLKRKIRRKVWPAFGRNACPSIKLKFCVFRDLLVPPIKCFLISKQILLY